MDDLSDKVALVTGGNSGIGREVALTLAARGAKVIIVGRRREKGEAVIQVAQEQNTSQPMTFISADLSEMTEAKGVARQVLFAHGHLDYLVHSAGVHHMRRTLTPDGVETNFAANYLSRFVLTNLLLERLQEGAGARIVIVGSPYVFNPKTFLRFHGLYGERPSSPIWALVKAGMAVSVWTVELARRLEETGVTVNTVVPGVVRTDILRNDPILVRWMDKLIQPFVGMSAEQGAVAPLYALLSPEVEGLNGQFFKGTRRGPKRISVPKGTYDPEVARRLWTFSEKLTVGKTPPLQLVRPA